MRGRGAAATTVRATLWILLAAAAVGGVLELADLASGTAPVEVADPAWTQLGALGGLGRLALLAAVGTATTVAVLAVAARLRARAGGGARAGLRP